MSASPAEAIPYPPINLETSPNRTLPERKLVFACLEAGIRDFLRTPCTDIKDVHYGRGCNTRGNHIKWLLSEEFYPFSFAWCCEVLNQDPARVRMRITNLKLSAGLQQRYVIKICCKRSHIKGRSIDDICT